MRITALPRPHAIPWPGATVADRRAAAALAHHAAVHRLELARLELATAVQFVVENGWSLSEIGRRFTCSHQHVADLRLLDTSARDKVAHR